MKPFRYLPLPTTGQAEGVAVTTRRNEGNGEISRGMFNSIERRLEGSQGPVFSCS